MNDDEGLITRTTDDDDEDDDEDAPADDDSLLSSPFVSSMSIVIYLLCADWFNRLKTISTRQMLLIKRLIDIDELCVEASKRSKNERRVLNFKFRSSSSVVDCDFRFALLWKWFPSSSRAFTNWRKHSWLPKKTPKNSKNELYSSNISKTAMVTW